MRLSWGRDGERRWGDGRAAQGVGFLMSASRSYRLKRIPQLESILQILRSWPVTLHIRNHGTKRVNGRVSRQRSRKEQRGLTPAARARAGGRNGNLGKVWPTYLLLSGRTRTQTATATAPSSAILPGWIPGNRTKTSAPGASERKIHPAFKFKISQTPRLIEPRPRDVIGRSICVAARGTPGRRRVHG